MMAMCIYPGNAYLYRSALPGQLVDQSYPPEGPVTTLHCKPYKEVTPVTPLMITLLVIAGIVILIAIAT